MERKIRLAMIMGSDREGRFCDTVARWVEKQISRRDEFSLDVIDPLELSLPSRLTQTDSPEVEEYRNRIRKADAFVVVTPEYNHGYSATLKTMIDHADEEWYAKPVAFVSYGGISGGLRAVEQLRLVFAELHAVTIRDTVSFHFAWEQFDADGEPVQGEIVEEAMTILLDRLLWWAKALLKAREAEPYMQERA
ncbi:MAG: NAD(P)H-dependent oxidoreductase [Firmicutes bacterium]|jgi:NAD(P)H-dependent FMN reductase|nr:NAD(P)H-dependent oxidoreductase [Bacillota bacterium]